MCIRDSFLGRGCEEKLVGMWKFRGTPHRFEQRGAAHAIVPGFGKIVIRAIQHQERRVGNHRVAGRDPQGANLGFVLCADIEIDLISREDARAFLRCV